MTTAESVPMAESHGAKVFMNCQVSLSKNSLPLSGITEPRTPSDFDVPVW